MRIFVCIKQVPDTETKIKVNSDKTGIDETGVKWILNPYDEFGVEEALKIKSSSPQAQVTVISVGPKSRVVDSLRTALAMGADDAIVIDTNDTIDTNLAAQALAASIRSEGDFSLIFTGKMAIDDQAASLSQQLAHYLEIPHTTVVSKMSVAEGTVEVQREVEGGTQEILELKMPCLVAANKGLNQPRYASLPGIMKAKKKPLKEFSLDSLGIDPSAKKLIYKNFELPKEKPPVKMIEGEASQQAQGLVQLLREEAKVI